MSKFDSKIFYMRPIFPAFNKWAGISTLRGMNTLRWVWLVACNMTAASGLLMGQSTGKASAGEDWPVYGNDAGGMRYSPLREINEQNVGRLKPAWIYRTGELRKYEGTAAMEKAAFEATPIKIGRTLYFSTPSCRVIALDAGTGQEKWVFDPGVDLHKGYSEISSRGVSAWPAPGSGGSGDSHAGAGNIPGAGEALNRGSSGPRKGSLWRRSMGG